MNDPIYCARFVETLKGMLKERMRWASIRIRDREMVLSLIDACLAGEYPYKSKGVIRSSKHMKQIQFKYLKDEGKLMMSVMDVRDNVEQVKFYTDFQELHDDLDRLRDEQGVRFRNTVLGALIKKLKFRRSLTDSRYQGVDW